MTQITHERCSELLAEHHRGELGPEDASAVERHLAGCGDCRAELAGLRALSGAVDFEPLGDDERQRLRDAVTQQARLAPGQVYELPARRTFWERHAGQVVGAAASIVVILFAYLALGLPGRDDAGDDGGDGAGGGQPAIAEGESLDADAGSEGPQPVFITADLRAQADAAEDDTATAPRSALLGLQNRSKHTERSIQELGERGLIFREFSEAYTVDHAGLAENFLNQLASEAPDDELRDRVLECGASLLGDDPERPLLPAFASVAEFMEQESLILGFVTSDGLTPELNRYSIWAWPVDNCEVILIGTSGHIRP
jgi:hypothetical protein